MTQFHCRKTKAYGKILENSLQKLEEGEKYTIKVFKIECDNKERKTTMAIHKIVTVYGQGYGDIRFIYLGCMIPQDVLAVIVTIF